MVIEANVAFFSDSAGVARLSADVSAKIKPQKINMPQRSVILLVSSHVDQTQTYAGIVPPYPQAGTPLKSAEDFGSMWELKRKVNSQ